MWRIITDEHGKRRRVAVMTTTDGLWIGTKMGSFWLPVVKQTAPAQTASEHSLSATIVAPLTGRIVAVHVAVDDKVETNQVLMVLEAMKMEYSICATHAGIVSCLGAEVGSQVTQGMQLVYLR